jgi:hypothetical protein
MFDRVLVRDAERVGNGSDQDELIAVRPAAGDRRPEVARVLRTTRVARCMV